MRAALTRFRELGQTEQELELAADLARFWTARSRHREAETYLEQAVREDSAPALVRARALQAAYVIAWASGDFEGAQRFGAPALALFEELRDARGIYQTLLSIGIVLYCRGDLESSRRHLQRALALAAEAGDARSVAAITASLADLANCEKDFERAVELAREADELAHRVGDDGTRSNALSILAVAQLQLETR